MTFRLDEIAAFLAVFDASKDTIRAMPGCRKLHLLADLHDPAVFTTISVWDSEADLNAYRNSPFFENVWAQTKALFADKPLAFSMRTVREVDD